MAIDPRLNGLQGGIASPIAPANRGAAKPHGANAPSFDEILRTRQGLAPGTAGNAPLKFSAHAQTRMQSRNLDLQPAQMERLEGAVQKAAGKGSRDALVLLDNMAMVVSISNRTVVTVADSDQLKQNVFTNIDSAVIA